jgi:hypothetical protein
VWYSGQCADLEGDRGSGSTPPLILYLGTSWRQVLKCTATVTLFNIVIVHFVWGLLEGRGHLEDLNVDVRIILW